MSSLLSVLIYVSSADLNKTAVCSTAAGFDVCHAEFRWPPIKKKINEKSNKSERVCAGLTFSSTVVVLWTLPLLFLVTSYWDQTCLSQQFIFVRKAPFLKRGYRRCHLVCCRGKRAHSSWKQKRSEEGKSCLDHPVMELPVFGKQTCLKTSWNKSLMGAGWWWGRVPFAGMLLWGFVGFLLDLPSPLLCSWPETPADFITLAFVSMLICFHPFGWFWVSERRWQNFIW